MIITIERRHLWIVGAILLLLVVAFFLNRRQPDYIHPDAVWRAAQAEGRKHNLDPAFIFAIAMAESSLNGHADSGYARGLMQLSEAAWKDTTHRDYQDAFRWRTNMAVATDFLVYLRGRLEAAEQFDYARLAAAYRHGYAALARKEFAISAMPAPRNLIYQELFAGTIPHPTRYGVSANRAPPVASSVSP